MVTDAVHSRLLGSGGTCKIHFKASQECCEVSPVFEASETSVTKTCIISTMNSVAFVSWGRRLSNLPPPPAECYILKHSLPAHPPHNPAALISNRAPVPVAAQPPPFQFVPPSPPTFLLKRASPSNAKKGVHQNMHPTFAGYPRCYQWIPCATEQPVKHICGFATWNPAIVAAFKFLQFDMCTQSMKCAVLTGDIQPKRLKQAPP